MYRRHVAFADSVAVSFGKIPAMRLPFYVFLWLGVAMTAYSADDPATSWLRADAPRSHLVRADETEREVILRFVRRPQDWSRVWCPWPGYVPTPPLRTGDLLVQVLINGRTWIQRVRRASGPRPHQVLLRAFDTTGLDPFRFVLPDDAQPEEETGEDDPQVPEEAGSAELEEAEPAEEEVQEIEIDPSSWQVHLPRLPLHTSVLQVLSGAGERPDLFRIGAGRAQLLAPGTAVDIVAPGSARAARTVVVHAEDETSYVVVLSGGSSVMPGARVRGPGAWCEER